MYWLHFYRDYKLIDVPNEDKNKAFILHSKYLFFDSKRAKERERERGGEIEINSERERER